MNTNVINDGEILFSDEYIIKNKKIVSNFIAELFNEYGITDVEIETTPLASIVINVLGSVKVINSLKIRKDDTITFTLIESIINNHNVKLISCYQAPEYVIQYLDKYHIELDSRSEIFFTSKFMDSNDLNQYSKIYYKKEIDINTPISNDDNLDFETFLKINKYLKVIYISKFNKDGIELIIKLIKQYKLKDIKVLIKDININENDAIYLKNINKKFKKYVNVKLNYSKDYIKDNYLAHVSFTILKFSVVLAMIMIFTAMSYIFVSNYFSGKNVDVINEEISKIVTTTQESLVEEDVVEGVHGPSVIKELQGVNPDTVGWLTVRNTNINYPVVQHSDNDYYLDKNYYGDRDYSGWVFMDFRNDVDVLQHNTIIYAHNRFNSGLMFGTLDNVLDEEWLDNKNNHIITFNTLYEEMSFEIFSVYEVKNTNDYIANNFNSDNHYLTFIELITGRSEYDFGVTVSTDDNILTLSTCYEYSNRFVVHARLIK